MNLKILIPTGVLIDRRVNKITAEAGNGSFCLLPRHIDFVAALVAGMLSYETDDGEEEFIGLDEGILVKAGAEVLVSTPRAVRGRGLDEISQIIEREFLTLDERESKARSATAKLEADLVRRFMEMDHESF